MDTKHIVSKLILVYDADRGMMSAVIDSARKLFRVNGCALCSITHGLAGEKSEWRSCRDELGLEVAHLHRDEITPELASIIDGQLPCVLGETDDGPVMLLAPEVLERCRGSVGDFRGRLLTHAAMRDLEILRAS